jgi:hypothetical protein
LVDQEEPRNRFFFDQPSLAFVGFVKATQFLWQRYERTLNPCLNKLERSVRDAVRNARAATESTVLEKVIRELTTRLQKFSRRLYELEYDSRDVELARVVIEDIIRANGGTVIGGNEASPLIGPVARYDRQMHSDLVYFRSTEQAGIRELQSQQTLVDIENTHAERQLAVIALILASTLGLAAVLPPGDWQWAIKWLIPGLAEDDRPLAIVSMVRVAIIILGVGLAFIYYVGFWPSKSEK